jgi:peroxiredoxin
MPLAVGERLPQASFKVPTPEGVQDLTTDDIFAGRRVVLIGMPGAFTPTCSNNHLPGYLAYAEAIKAKGVDAIAVVAVNDHHVMKAWAAHMGAEAQILFLADGNAEFTRAAGMDADMSGGNMGLRTRRFSALVEDGVLRFLAVEEKRGVAELTGVEEMLPHL